MKLAMIGLPNSGKSTLFNALTQGLAKIANYPGVTIEQKQAPLIGQFAIDGCDLIDLPGLYSLDALTPDEVMTLDFLLEKKTSHSTDCDGFLFVIDYQRIFLGLQLLLEFIKHPNAKKKPILILWTKYDLDPKFNAAFNTQAIENYFAPIPFLKAEKKQPLELAQKLWNWIQAQASFDSKAVYNQQKGDNIDFLKTELKNATPLHSATQAIDQILLHPIWGLLIFILTCFFLFESLFTFAQWPMQAIEQLFDHASTFFEGLLPESYLRSLILLGILPGIAAVILFLPQIMILFLFLFILEEMGYLARVAYLMDGWMTRLGLNGRAFIPLLSSYACAIPGILATRTIGNKAERIATLMAAPLMTCSARLPVFTLLIGTFIPNVRVGWINLQGLVLFLLYFLGTFAGLAIAAGIKFFFFKPQWVPFFLELPTYQIPRPKKILQELYLKGKLFVESVSTVIVTVSILLWFLASFPVGPIEQSFAGKIGHFLEPLFLPIGFNWKIIIALIPGLMAREVMIGSLATVYAIEASQKEITAMHLSELIHHSWSIPTGLSLLIWYVFACQCTSTLAVIYQETGTWKWPALSFSLMMTLAYAASYLTYQLSLLAGL